MRKTRHFHASKNSKPEKTLTSKQVRLRKRFHLMRAMTYDSLAINLVQALSPLLLSFFLNGSLLYFRDDRNSVAFFIGKIPLLATARSIETHQAYHSKTQNTLPPLPPNRFFYHPDSGW